MTQSGTATLIQALREPGRYPHPAGPVTVLETHISWVLLTGPYAYKIKKPINLGFLDFSTLEQRRFYCQEELRLNQRLAPQLYLDIVAIGGSADDPILGADSGIIEYAVRMVQFDPANRLDRLLERGQLRASDVDALAQTLAHAHEGATVSPTDGGYGTPPVVHKPVRENFDQIGPHLHRREEREQLTRLRSASEQAFDRLQAAFAQRLNAGRVRECHGDAHLANMVRFHDEPVLFDCLEFDPALRWIDVMSDLAFATMDLHARGRADFGRRLLDRYLQHSGDYTGLAVLRFYQAYRAVVRAKVAVIDRDRVGTETAHSTGAKDLYAGYAALAEAFLRPLPRALLITVGVSGSGKTTVTDGLLEQFPLIRIRSDVERKRLFGFRAGERTGADMAAVLYGPDAGRHTYQRLADLARETLVAGFPVVLDATFLRASWRQDIARLAAELGVPFLILEFRAPVAIMRQRVAERERRGSDASEAGLEVLEKQLSEQEALTAKEEKIAFSADTSDSMTVEALIDQLRDRLFPAGDRDTYI
jgi:aminoglycoside phosphotransferase family enzyme/predicted kinase